MIDKRPEAAAATLVAYPAPATAPDAATRLPAGSGSGFAWLRLLLALVVVFDHSWPLSNLDDPNSLPASWHFSPGYAALTGFFAMSGYQIANSWSADPSAWRFMGRRVLRIWPPLLTVVLFTALVIGPLVTTVRAHEYWSDDLTWGYIVHGAELYPLQHLLPGVFWHNPYPFSVNGSLWTLPMETTGYVLVLLVGLAGLLRRARWLLFVPLVAFVYLDSMFLASPASPGGGGELIGVPVGSFVSFMVPFVLGMIMYAYRGQLPLRPWIAGILAVAYVIEHMIAPNTIPDRYAFALMFSYFCITAAHHTPKALTRFDRWVRGSYGICLWAFPIQQLLAFAGIHNHWTLALLAIPAGYIAGLLSWHLIETPTAKLRSYLRAKPRGKGQSPI